MQYIVATVAMCFLQYLTQLSYECLASALRTNKNCTAVYSHMASGVSALDQANLLPAISNIILKNIEQVIFSRDLGHRRLADRGTHRACSSDMSLAKFFIF